MHDNIKLISNEFANLVKFLLQNFSNEFTIKTHNNNDDDADKGGDKRYCLCSNNENITIVVYINNNNNNNNSIGIYDDMTTTQVDVYLRTTSLNEAAANIRYFLNLPSTNSSHYKRRYLSMMPIVDYVYIDNHTFSSILEVYQQRLKNLVSSKISLHNFISQFINGRNYRAHVYGETMANAPQADDEIWPRALFKYQNNSCFLLVVDVLARLNQCSSNSNFLFFLGSTSLHTFISCLLKKIDLKTNSITIVTFNSYAKYYSCFTDKINLFVLKNKKILKI